MSDRLTTYPEYKDSGVPWLDKVPAHWEVRRQRNVANMLVSNVDKHTIEDEIPVRLCNYVDVYKHDVITDRIPFMRATASQAEINRFCLQIDDVVITKDSETWDDIGVPALVAYEAPDLVCGYHLAILRPRKGVICGDFLLRALQSQGVAAQHYVSANGITRFGLSQDAIKSVWIPLPPLEEQTAIARFLDHHDRLTRRYIRAQRRLIELLTEQKQALIQRAVTRGLPSIDSGQATPDVPLKDFGIEWLGEIPAYWDVVSLGGVCSRIVDGPHVSPSYVDDGVMFISARNVKTDSWAFDDAKYVSWDDYELFSRKIRPERGDVLYTKGGTTGVARAVDFDQPFQVWVHIAVLKVRKEVIDPFYLAYALNSPRSYEQSQLYTRGATNQDLGLNRMARIRFCLPPLEEQKSLIYRLDRSIGTIQETILRTQRQIDLVREYRTRLIADVVTGKLDVRHAAVHLAEEAEELEELDEDETEEEVGRIDD